MPEVLATGNALTAYERRGCGPPLVLMHGAEASRQQFALLLPYLEPHFTVVIYDQRDCGDTEAPPHPATLAELADDAAALIVALDIDRAHVFGSSFGGRIAQALALRHPQRVDRLVLGSTWPLPQPLEVLNPEGVARLDEVRRRLPESAEALAALFFGKAFLEEQPHLKSFFAQVRPASERSMRRSAAVVSTLDADPSMIAAATLVLTGSADQVVPPAITLSIAKQLLTCESVVLEGVGHATTLQAPATVARHLVRFLLTA